MPLFNPNNHTEGGGFLDDEVVVFKEVRCAINDYQGKSSAVAPALMAVMELAEDDSADPVTQYWSCGAVDNWQPSDDGKTFEAVGTATTFRKTCNMSIFLASLLEAGFPESELDKDDVTVIEGLKARVVQVPAPSFSRNGEDNASAKKRTVLAIAEILEMPGSGKKRGRPAGSKSKKDVISKAVEGPSEVEQLTEDTMVDVLKAAGEPMGKKELSVGVLKALKGNDNRTDCVNLSRDEDFLNSSDKWVYDADDQTVELVD